MPLPFTTPRLDPEVRTSLAGHLGRKPAVLAWARTADGHVVGLAGRLLVQDDAGWKGYPWHEIDAGQWDSKTGRLAWADAAGTGHEVVLPGRSGFTDLFNERITASVLFTRRIDLGRGRHVTLAARRNLEPGSDETLWRVAPSEGVDLATPAVQARVDQELAAARSDFGIA